jgi:site-specific DNA-methyltransferase (adenine-specific)
MARGGSVIDEALEVIAGKRQWSVICAEAWTRVLRELPDGSIDGLCTDAPYSSGGAFRGDRNASTTAKYVQTGSAERAAPEFEGDSRDQRAFVSWCTLWLTECYRLLADGAPVCLFTDWRQLPCTTDALQAAGFVWRGILPWDKTEAVRPQMGRFRSQAEYVVWGSKGPMPLERGVGVLPGVVRAAARENEDKHHQAGKPISALREVVKIVRPDGVCLDPFAGSASMGVACKREGRRYIGIEVVPYFADLSRKRLEAEDAGLLLRDVDAGQVGLFGAGQ